MMRRYYCYSRLFVFLCTTTATTWWCCYYFSSSPRSLVHGFATTTTTTTDVVSGFDPSHQHINRCAGTRRRPLNKPPVVRSISSSSSLINGIRRLPTRTWLFSPTNTKSPSVYAPRRRRRQQLLGYDTTSILGRIMTTTTTTTTTPSRLCMTTAMTAVTTTTLTMMNTFHADPMYCLTGLFLLSAFGLALEERTKIGRALSAPLATMAAALLMSNIGLLPFTSTTYNVMNSFAVNLAVPMLLFDSNLQTIRKSTRPSLLLAFGLASVTVLIGTIVAMKLMVLALLSFSSSSSSSAITAMVMNMTPIASALTARHIGGAINFVAVAETLRIPARTVSAAMAADNVVVALYFALLFALAKPTTAVAKRQKNEPVTTTTVVDAAATDATVQKMIDNQQPGGKPAPRITLSSIAASFATSAVLVTIGKSLTGRFLPPGISALPLTSMLTVLAATVLSLDQSLAHTGSVLGVFLVQLFFAASGVEGSIRLVVTEAPMLVVFSLLQILVHFVLLVTLGRRLPFNDLLLASNAAVGGPTTAAAMAQAKGWNVVPALLIGILGYAIATPIALALVPLLKWVLAP